MNKLEIRAGVVCKFLPCTAKKPDRYSVQVGSYPKKIMSIHLVECDDIGYPFIAQALVEMRLKELDLSWELNGVCAIGYGTFIFTIK